MPTARRRPLWFLVFLALLWFGATFVYFGDTGKHSDDYWAASRLIDREGIDWSSHPWQSWPYFWRPLHLAHVWIVNTIFWHHFWAAHLELALVHAAVCVLLYRLLVNLGSARGPAMAAALLYGTCPLLGEAIGWASASCNAIGSLLMLITLEMGRRFGSALPVGQVGVASTPGSAAHTIRGLLAIAIVSFAAACFYEPAAAGLAAIPIVVWTACPRGTRIGVRLRRTVLATSAAGLSCALYVALLLGTSPPGNRGAAETVADLHSLPENTSKLARAIRHVLAGTGGLDFVLGSIEQGLAAAREHPLVLGVIVATVLAGLLAAINGRRTRPPAVVDPEDNPPGARGQLLLLLGVVLLVVPWAPFVAQHARGFDLRSLYVPMIGGAFLGAAAGNGLCRWMGTLTDRGRAASGTIATIAVGLLAIAGEVGLVGVQTQFQTNARQDALVAAQFAAMSASVEPDTVFMILAAEHRGAATSRPAYNAALHTALEASWCAGPFVRRAMHRLDVRVIPGEFWARGWIPVVDLRPKSVRETGLGAEERAIPWAKIVPLWIDSRAQVHIVEVLTVTPLNGSTLEIRLPRAGRLARAVPPILESDPDMPASTPRSVRLIETPYDRTRVVVDAGG